MLYSDDNNNHSLTIMGVYTYLRLARPQICPTCAYTVRLFFCIYPTTSEGIVDQKVFAWRCV